MEADGICVGGQRVPVATAIAPGCHAKSKGRVKRAEVCAKRYAFPSKAKNVALTENGPRFQMRCRTWRPGADVCLLPAFRLFRVELGTIDMKDVEARAPIFYRTISSSTGGMGSPTLLQPTEGSFGFGGRPLCLSPLESTSADSGRGAQDMSARRPPSLTRATQAWRRGGVACATLPERLEETRAGASSQQPLFAFSPQSQPCQPERASGCWRSLAREWPSWGTWRGEET